jgi:hypothetical protein
MLLGQISPQRPLSGDAAQMHPDKIVAHPPGSRGLGRVPCLVGERRILGGERVADAVFQRRIHQATPGHHQEQRPDTLRLCARERRGATLGGFQTAAPARRMALAFVAGQPRRRRQWGGVACVGGHDATTVLVHARLPGRA